MALGAFTRPLTREKDTVNYKSWHIFKTWAPILEFNKVFDNYFA